MGRAHGPVAVQPQSSNRARRTRSVTVANGCLTYRLHHIKDQQAAKPPTIQTQRGQLIPCTVYGITFPPSLTDQPKTSTPGWCNAAAVKAMLKRQSPFDIRPKPLRVAHPPTQHPRALGIYDDTLNHAWLLSSTCAGVCRPTAATSLVGCIASPGCASCRCRQCYCR